MSPNGKLVLATVASALLGATLGGAVVWGVQRQAIGALNSRLIAADAANQGSLQRIDELTNALETARNSSSGATSTTPPSVKPPVSQPTTVTPVAKTVKTFSYVSGTRVSGNVRYLSADYAQMLTGDAAAAAAAARGDESPPPNDYYIVNDNRKLRTLRITPGIKVTVTSNPDGTSDPSGHKITLSKWMGYYGAPTEGNAAIREAPYWIWVKGDTVTRIEQQYLP